MQAQRAEVHRRRAGARASTRRRPSKIFDLMEHFAGYGFNKSHSTAYALLAYQTAYLKANYPWHFMAALLTIESQNTDKLAMYLGECRERGIPVLPPDINESELRVHGRRPRACASASAAVKNVGEGGHRVDARGRASARAHRLAPRAVRGARPAARQQARAREPGQGGALDSLGAGAGRPAAAAAPCGRGCSPRSNSACEHGTRSQRDRDKGQAQLFGGAAGEDGQARRRSPRCRCPTRRRGPRRSSSRARRRRSGLYLSGHPIERFAAELAAIGARDRSATSPRRRGRTAQPAPGRAT